MGIVIFILAFILVLIILNFWEERLQKLPFGANLIVITFLLFLPYLAFKGFQLVQAYTYVSSVTNPAGLKLLWPIASTTDAGIYGGCATISFKLSDQSIKNLKNNYIPLDKSKNSKKINWKRTPIQSKDWSAGWHNCSLSKSNYNEFMNAASSDEKGLYGYYDHGQIVALPSIGILVYSEQSGR